MRRAAAWPDARPRASCSPASRARPNSARRWKLWSTDGHDRAVGHGVGALDPGACRRPGAARRPGPGAARRSARPRTITPARDVVGQPHERGHEGERVGGDVRKQRAARHRVRAEAAALVASPASRSAADSRRRGGRRRRPRRPRPTAWREPTRYPRVMVDEPTRSSRPCPPGSSCGRYAIDRADLERARWAPSTARTTRRRAPRWRSSTSRTRATPRASRSRRGCSPSSSHPRVVRVLDYFQDATGHYLVMELVEGTDLGAMLKERGNPGLPLSEVIEYARQACEALQYVHEQQIVHRDVKPQNLILGRERRRAGRLRHRARARRGGRRRHGGDRHAALHGAGGVRGRHDLAAQRRLRPRRDALDPDRRQAAGLRRPDPSSPTVCPEVSPSSSRRITAGLEMIPERRVASVERVRQGARRAARPQRAGASLALSRRAARTPRAP